MHLPKDVLKAARGMTQRPEGPDHIAGSPQQSPLANHGVVGFESGAGLETSGPTPLQPG